MIQSGNWRGARDPARELEGARNRYQPKFHWNGYQSGPEPELRSGPKINPINKFII